ncbi:MAG: hypothetical protein DLM66_00020 [Candidatus Dormiibacter spiritus]|nr:MAG: hypothetical protein DLM66_00020 [Candidatus Dormibacteraeota bacterium]
MARITPSTAEYVQLEDFEPYRFTFKDWEWSTGSEKYGSKRRVQVTLAVNNDPNDTVLDWINCAVGKQQGTGAPSKLCEFINAFAGKPAATEIAWFDDETGEWGYEDAATHGKLDDLFGREVIGRGRNKPKEDGSGSRYRIEHYQSATAKKPAAASNGGGGRAKPAPATAEVDPDSVPF